MRASELSAEQQRKIFGQVVDTPRPDPKSDTENLFAFQCRAHRLPLYKREHKFAMESHGRGWRFDYCWPEHMVACEIEGIVVTRVRGELAVSGRHVHPTGFRNDCLKYATAALLGWSVLRFEQTQVRQGVAVDFVKQMLVKKGWRG